MEKIVETNIGGIPVGDYREIKAGQLGFDSYDDMRKQGYKLGNGYDVEDDPVDFSQDEMQEGDIIHFSYNGESYDMTAEQIQAAYRYQEHAYRCMDAKAHIENYVFGTERDCLDEEEAEEAEREFYEEYGFVYTKLYEDVELMVQKFQDTSDCNIDENSMWESIISNCITERIS